MKIESEANAANAMVAVDAFITHLRKALGESGLRVMLSSTEGRRRTARLVYEWSRLQAYVERASPVARSASRFTVDAVTDECDSLLLPCLSLRGSGKSGDRSAHRNGSSDDKPSRNTGHVIAQRPVNGG